MGFFQGLAGGFLTAWRELDGGDEDAALPCLSVLPVDTSFAGRRAGGGGRVLSIVSRVGRDNLAGRSRTEQDGGGEEEWWREGAMEGW